MEGIFKPESKTIEELFGNKTSFYKIPPYQRPYTWENEHVEALWNDIFSAFENNQEDSEVDKNYFLGSVILTSDNSKTLNIIDGQQRMTTLMILFCVLRDLLEDKDINYNEINLDDIKESIEKKQQCRIVLNTHIKNQLEFEEEILRKVKFPEKFTKKDANLNKYMNTALILKDKIEGLLQEKYDIAKFLDYLFKNVRLITITCSSQEFAIKLFQTLNARGMDLSPADLIKSHLMSKLVEDQHDKFIQIWIDIEKIMDRLDEKIGDIFNYYQYYSLAQNPKKSLYDEIISIFGEKEPNVLIYELKKFAECYEEVIEDNIPELYTLFYLKHQLYWKSILVTAKFENYQRYDELVRLIRDFYYKYWIAGYTSQKIKQISFNIIGMIKNKKSYPEIKEILMKKEKEDNIYNRSIESLKSNCYNEAWCKPILILLEYTRVDESKLLNYLKVDKKIHVEHILPISWENNFEWNQNIKEKEKVEEYINNISNLTLLSGTKNIKATNDGFEKKKEIYRGKGKDGITSFQLTQDLLEYSTWNISELKERQKLLINEIINILDIN